MENVKPLEYMLSVKNCSSKFPFFHFKQLPSFPISFCDITNENCLNVLKLEPSTLVNLMHLMTIRYTMQS